MNLNPKKANEDDLVQEKIAELFGSVSPEELRVLVDTPYSHGDAKMAATLGFCEKLADYGLVPSDMNAVVMKRAGWSASGEAAAMGSAAVKGLTWAAVATTIGAVVAGNLTGKMHHKLERRINKQDDKENVRLREKAERLAAQRDELSEDLSSRPLTQLSTAPRATPAKQDIVQLLD